MDVSPAMDAAHPPPLDAAAAPLPAMVAGDGAPVVWRDHGWPGVLFYGFSYFTSVAVGVSAAMLLAASALGAYVESGFLVAPLCGAGAVVQWRIARAVSHFLPSGWYGAVMELGAAALAKGWYMTQGHVAAGLCGLALDAWLLRYFWKRREQFGVDLGG